jgi:tetratricopeptide (TPR) repeat protein
LYELPNLRQAWEESLYYGLYDQICRAAPALTAFYRRQGLIGEGMMELEPLITTLRVMLQDENVKNADQIYFTLAFLLIEKANFLVAQNSLEQARRVTEQALEYALSASNALGHMRCLYQMADIYNRSNKQERALAQVEKALELIQTESFEFDAQFVQVWVAWCFELCADIYIHLERYAEAIQRLERAAFLHKNSDQLMQQRLCEQKIKAVQEIIEAVA